MRRTILASIAALFTLVLARTPAGSEPVVVPALGVKYAATSVVADELLSRNRTVAPIPAASLCKP